MEPCCGWQRCIGSKSGRNLIPKIVIQEKHVITIKKLPHEFYLIIR